MTKQHIVVAGLLVALAVAAAFGFSATASAEPSPDPFDEPNPPVASHGIADNLEFPDNFVEPAIPAAPPNATPLGPLAQSDGAGGLGGMPADVSGNALLLGQTADPAAPGADPGTPPGLNAWNNAYLLPQNTEPAAPGEGTVVGVVPGNENGDVGRLDYLRRLHASYQDGDLRGALLGQIPLGQLPDPVVPPPD